MVPAMGTGGLALSPKYSTDDRCPFIETMYLVGDIKPADTSGRTEHQITGPFAPHFTSAYGEG